MSEPPGYTENVAGVVPPPPRDRTTSIAESLPEVPRLGSQLQRHVIVMPSDSLLGSLMGAQSNQTMVKVRCPSIQEEVEAIRGGDTIPNVITQGPVKPTLETDENLVMVSSVSSFQTYVNIMKLQVGIAVFTMAHAMRTAGMTVVLVAIAVTALSGMLASNHLVQVRRELKDRGLVSRDASYMNVANAAFGGGKVGAAVAGLVAVAIVAMGTGSVVGFLDFVTDMARDGGHQVGILHSHLRFWVPIVFCLVEVPMVLQRSMAVISYANVLALTALVLANILVITNFTIDVAARGIHHERSVFMARSLEDIVDAVAKVIYILTWQDSLYPLVSSMRAPEKAGKVVAASTATTSLWCAGYGVYGYMALGDRAKEVVFDSISMQSIAITCKVLVTFEGLACLSLTLISAREVLEGLVFEAIKNRHLGIPSHRMLNVVRWTTRLSLLFVCAVMAICIPEFSKAIDVVAGLPVCFLCLGLPSLLYALVIKAPVPVRILCVFIFLVWMVVGCLLTGLGVHYSLTRRVPVNPEINVVH